MGLDMYLFKVKKGDEKFIRDNKESENYAQIFGLPFKLYIGDAPLPFTVKLPKKRKNRKGYDILGYWCKANAVHNWFVNNVQNAIDDDSWHEVSKENLENLLDICKTVLASCEFDKAEEDLEEQRIKDTSVAEKLLPIMSGVFFGSFEYDGYYVNELIKTIDIIEKTLNTVDFSKHTVFYNAWS